MSHQSFADELVPILNRYEERGQAKMSHFDNRQVQNKGNYYDNPTDLPSQSVESSGSREISNGSMWLHKMMDFFSLNVMFEELLFSSDNGFITEYL